MYVKQFSKKYSPDDSRFIRPKNYELRSNKKAYATEQKRIDTWNQPRFIKSIVINDLYWDVYEDDYHNDTVLRTEINNYIVEITYQGNFTIKALEELLGFFKEA